MLFVVSFRWVLEYYFYWIDEGVYVVEWCVLVELL